MPSMNLNQQCPSIQFTIEEEKEERIAFLDVCVTCQGDKMSTAVYQKPTHTDRYLPFSSHHHPRVLTEVMRCMKGRALQVCDDAHRHQELKHLEKVFLANGFPKKLVETNLSMPRVPSTPLR